MSRWWLGSALVIACAALSATVYWQSTPAPQLVADGVTHAGSPPVEAHESIPAISTEPATKYLFDVHGHTATEIIALLNRAHDTYENLPEELRVELRIAMVLHGPDVEFFASVNYDEHKELVDLAARLDAFGFVDLKVCAASVRSHGLEHEKFPPFIEFVPFGPAEITRLESEGYMQL